MITARVEYIIFRYSVEAVDPLETEKNNGQSLTTAVETFYFFPFFHINQHKSLNLQ